MKIAVEGCAHGELEKIYDTIQGIEKAENIKVDLLLCCGDFQSTRNIDDLQTMAVPKKYVNMGTFYKYYSGELVAPMLTIFIGGNHESSNYLQELAYGGWVAPNIYYLGLASVVRVNGIRIAGISGIYKGYDFLRGHFEFSPYTESSMTSVYHVRQLEVFRLKQLSGEIDIFMSHDWPRGIYNYGNKEQLLRFKRHFREDVENNELGSKPCEDLLNVLKPSYWFAAHLHCKFSALVPHIDYDAAKDDNSDEDEDSNESAPANKRYTKFLALDKCLPRRRFLQVLDIETPPDYITEGPLRFEYDLEWLTILSLTNHLLSVKPSKNYMPGPLQESNGERYKFTPTAEELAQVRRRFNDNLEIPRNFCRTVEPYDGVADYKQCGYVPQPKAQINPQATQFCDLLSIDDPVSIAMLIGGHELSHSTSLNDSSLLADESHASLNTTDCSNTSILQTTPLKRKSLLNLPKPSCLSESVEIGLDGEEEDDVERPLSKSNVGELGAATDVAQADAINEDSEGLPSSKPPLKKLKRRNQNIYNVDDDADADDAEATQIET